MQVSCRWQHGGFVIRLDNISKYYYSANAVVPALRKISMEFHKGEFVAIVGESGSGKSTLLNIISGQDGYDDGELFLQDVATSDYDSADWQEYRQNKIGFIDQNYNLIEHYSVLHNVESALFIQGYGVKEAKRIATQLIHRVGLGDKLHQRTSKLSGGQKQRLSIARALAKDTDIIIADEPTGNLDPDNGRQIMELLCSLSKERLIITVTHDFEEAAPYVTRKIRLHDGEIVSDTVVAQRNEAGLSANAEINSDEITQSINSEESGRFAGRRHNFRSDAKTAWRFARMNIMMQPGRALLFLSLLFLMAAVSFLFLGEIESNWDDTFCKVYDAAYFANADDTRIVVKKPDGSPITEEDIENFNTISYVRMADGNDYCNDINYYFAEGTDYEYVYLSTDHLVEKQRRKLVKFLENSNYMKSTSCITEGDLTVGRMPETRDEIVIYSEDESLLGSKQTCFFTSRNSWSYDEYYAAELTVVGLLKEDSGQVFFSEQLCNMLTAGMYDNQFSLAANKNIFTNEYTTNISFYPIIGDDLKSGQVRASIDLSGTDSGLIGAGVLTAELSGEEHTYKAEILDSYHNSTMRFIEISEEWFKELCHQESRQASIYIRDYIDTDYVLAALEDMGYDAISSYRISSIGYNQSTLFARNAAIFRAAIVLLIMSILEIIIVRAIMKIRNKDFNIFSSMGMKLRTVTMINYFELYLYTLIAVLFTIAAVQMFRLFRLDYMTNLMKYYNFSAILIYFTFNFVITTLTVWSSNRSLKRRLERAKKGGVEQ